MKCAKTRMSWTMNRAGGSWDIGFHFYFVHHLIEKSQ